MSWRRELAAARWTRRLGVPAWMIAAATARRLAGDWRGACAAAHVDVELDPSAIARGDGGAVAARVEDDLRHLVPDLLRWHLDPAQPVTVLSVYEGGRALFVLRRAPERLALRYGAVPPDSWRGSLVHSRERWDSRKTGALAERPFLNADGSRLPEEAWGLAEHVITMQDAGDWIGAWRLAGFDLEPLVGRRPELRVPGAPAARRVWRLNLTGLSAAIRSAGAPSEGVLLDHVDGAYTTHVKDETVTGVAGEADSEAAWRLPAALVERPVDADLVRLGMLPASALHPRRRGAVPRAVDDAAGAGTRHGSGPGPPRRRLAVRRPGRPRLARSPGRVAEGAAVAPGHGGAAGAARRRPGPVGVAGGRR
ncbi:hypothetical protein [Dactylosporangium cerinum]